MVEVVGLRVLPFLERFREPVRSGRKTATTRSKAYGKPGDLLQGPDCVLRLLVVMKVPLGQIAEEYWREEYCESPEEFKEVWCGIHPRKGFVPEEEMFLHLFEVIR